MNLSVTAYAVPAFGPGRNHRLLPPLATNMPPACLLYASAPLHKGAFKGVKEQDKSPALFIFDLRRDVVKVNWHEVPRDAGLGHVAPYGAATEYTAPS